VSAPRRRTGGAARRRGARRRTAAGRRAARRGRMDPQQAARSRLRHFRQATILAVAMTSLLLLLFAPGEVEIGLGQTAGDTAPAAEREIPDTVAVIEPVATEDLVRQREAEREEAPRDATEDVVGTLEGMWAGFVNNLPRYGIAVGILLLAGVLVRLTRLVLRRVLRGWERTDATAAMAGIVIWLLGFGIAISIMVGDVRALVGSVGLVGLALSWALQAPIESFTAWLMNSFKGYYRIGDRIAVGEAFGDVYRIDFLTTTLWEYGGADRPPGQVRAEQPTGRLITFPNSEVLSGSIVNFSRDFPWVWDEIELPIEKESDVRYAADVFLAVAQRVVGEYMREPAARYEQILRRARLEMEVPGEPQVFVALTEGWVALHIRYLVGARERRVWRSQLATALMEEAQKPEHAEKIMLTQPRQQLQLLDEKARVQPLPPVLRDD
jgi:small-conductance mechanosensitive channel